MSSLNDLPIGYEFYVENGGWHGKIVEVDDVKYIYVFEKDAFFNLTEAKEEILLAYNNLQEKNETVRKLTE